MKKSDVLKRVKQLLWNGKPDAAYEFSGDLQHRRYICHVITFDMERLRTTSVGIEVKLDVRKALAYHDSYEDYLKATLGIFTFAKMSSEQIQEGRHRLLDDMIADYESRGE